MQKAFPHGKKKKKQKTDKQLKTVLSINAQLQLTPGKERQVLTKQQQRIAANATVDLEGKVVLKVWRPGSARVPSFSP